MPTLQIALDCVGTEAEVQQIAAKAAAPLTELSYEVVQDDKAQWPTIVAKSGNYDELIAFGLAVYGNESADDIAYLISAID
jgi:hypothetical protein